MKKLAVPKIHALLLLILLTTLAQAKTTLHLCVDAMSWNELSKSKKSDLRYFKTSNEANHRGFALQPFSPANTGPAHIINVHR
jgi:hypothetical protein